VAPFGRLLSSLRGSVLGIPLRIRLRLSLSLAVEMHFIDAVDFGLFVFMVLSCLSMLIVSPVVARAIPELLAQNTKVRTGTYANG
jgi:hypothetical protein